MASFILISVVLIVAQAVNGKPGMFDSALHGAMQVMGTVENAVSPSAMASFCQQNGYTVWVGEGPPPQPDSAIGSAWSAWGTVTGAGFGALASALGGEAGIQGKCDASGWAKPGSLAQTSQPPTSGSYNVIGSQPGQVITTTYPGQPGGQYITTNPGTPSTTQTQYYPGQPGQTIITKSTSPSTSIQYYPGQPGQTIITKTTNPSTTTQYYPGQPGTSTTTHTITPGTPGTVQYIPGQPGSVTISRNNPTQQQCLCPCS